VRQHARHRAWRSGFRTVHAGSVGGSCRPAVGTLNATRCVRRGARR
jgi:hypothetical protein